jgi:hypothetical protein
MSAGSGIPALYREFTDALTDFSRKMPAVLHAVADLRGHALRSKDIRSITNMNIF